MINYAKGLTAIVLLGLTAAQAPPAEPETSAKEEPAQEIQSVRIHPVFAEGFACQNHWEGQLAYLGDALGTDCLVTQLVEVAPDRAFSTYFTNDGLKNEDWFSWRKEVLAPFNGTVKRIMINDVTNEPGSLGKPPASFLIFERADGVNVLIAHVREIEVKEGDQVTAGQVVARVGNNGFGRTPHLHLGAWKDDTPLQIQFDLAAQGRLMRTGDGP